MDIQSFFGGVATTIGFSIGLSAVILGVDEHNPGPAASGTLLLIALVTLVAINI